MWHRGNDGWVPGRGWLFEGRHHTFRVAGISLYFDKVEAATGLGFLEEREGDVVNGGS